MITGHVFIAISLDGCVARKDHRLDWLFKWDTEGEDHDFEVFMDSVDGIIMGRGSYENVLNFGEWPYSKPVVVMSKSLSQEDIPEKLEGKVRLVDLDPLELMESLQREGWSRAYVDGGKVVQSFIRDGLIKDFILVTVPILIGDGIRLFGDIDSDIVLELTDLKSFKSGFVQAQYRVTGEGNGSK